MYRRSLLAIAFAAALAPPAAKAAGRDTDTVRLTWGFGDLPLIAKERGEFAKTLAKDNIRVEWIGPFPNHAPTIQAVVGGSADFSFGGSTTPALAAILAGSPLLFSLFAVVEPRTTAIIVKGTVPASTACRTWWASPSLSIAPAWLSSFWSQRWRSTASTAAR